MASEGLVAISEILGRRIKAFERKYESKENVEVTVVERYSVENKNLLNVEDDI